MRRIAIFAVAVGLLFASGAIGPAFGQNPPSPAEPVGRSFGAGTSDVFADTYDMVFNANPPCRVVDTRLAGGKLGVGTVRSFRVLDELTSASNFSDQGGNSAGCGASPFAAAVALNITAVEPTKNGRVRAWPFDVPTPPVPNATILNYGTETNFGTGTTLQVCNEQIQNTCTKDIFFKNFSASTHLVIEVLGYYTRQTFAAVGADGSFVDGNQIFGTLRTGPGEYVVSFVQIVPLCGWVAAIEGPTTGQITSELDPQEEDPTVLLVHTTDSAGLAADRAFQVHLRC